MPQTITLSLFKLDNIAAKYWAFSMMQFGHARMQNTKGLTFYKLMGSGAGGGFKWHPNFGRYALLAVWENEQNAQTFFKENTFFQKYQQKSKEQLTVFMRCFHSHGFWSNEQPFVPVNDLEMEGQIAVITRATIKTKYLKQFWKEVPSVSANITHFEGRILSVGVGEWPIFQQATFSIWESAEQMKNYAYKNPRHRAVIQKTRELGWYKEELFARFKPYKITGSWENIDFYL